MEIHPAVAPSAQAIKEARVRVGREVSGRGGKGVSVISGLPLGAAALDELATQLKKLAVPVAQRRMGASRSRAIIGTSWSPSFISVARRRQAVGRLSGVLAFGTRVVLGLVAGLVVGALLTATATPSWLKIVPALEPLGTLWLSAAAHDGHSADLSMLITGIVSAAETAATGRDATRAIVIFLDRPDRRGAVERRTDAAVSQVVAGECRGGGSLARNRPRPPRSKSRSCRRRGNGWRT